MTATAALQTDKTPAQQPAETATSKPKIETRYVTVLAQPDGLVEQVYDPATDASRFELSPREGSRSFARHVGIEATNVTLYPVRSDLIRKGRLLLPTQSEDYGSTPALVGEIRTHLRKYVALSADDENTVTHYILFTWLFDRFQTAPYLRFIGDLGTGKSRALKVVGELCYKPFKVSGCASLSPVFRSLDQIGGCTLCMDEVDFFTRNEAHQEMMNMLRVGFQRDAGVLRSERVGDDFTPRDYAVFGPKVLAGRKNFPDLALESRTIRIYMQTGLALDNIPTELPPGYEAEATRLRNMLLRWRFDHYFKPLNPVAPMAIEPRLKQVYEPLAAVIDDPKALEVLRQQMAALQTELTEGRSGSFEGRVLGALLKHHEKSQAQDAIKIHVKGIAEGMPPEGLTTARVSPKKVASVCRGFGLPVEKDAAGVYVLFAPGSAKELLARHGLAAEPKPEPSQP